MRHAKVLSTLIGISAFAAVPAFSDDSAAIQKKLVSEYALTQPTANNDDVVTAGAVLVLKKNDLMMASVSANVNPYVNTYKDGKISQNAYGKIVQWGRHNIPGYTPNDTRTFVSGQRMWVTRIEVNKDDIVFDLFTDSIHGVRYKGPLKFALPKGFAITTDQADQLVAEVFGVQPDPVVGTDQRSGQSVTPVPQAPSEAGSGVAPVAPPPPVPEIAPPPPPTDQPTAPSPRVGLGLTKDQVVAIFGPPQRVEKNAQKEIYVYQGLKVIFTDGKVSEVQ